MQRFLLHYMEERHHVFSPPSFDESSFRATVDDSPTKTDSKSSRSSSSSSSSTLSTSTDIIISEVCNLLRRFICDTTIKAVILTQHGRRFITNRDDIDHALLVQTARTEVAKETESRMANAQQFSNSSNSSNDSNCNSVGNSTGHDDDVDDDDSNYSNSGSDDDDDDDDDDESNEEEDEDDDEGSILQAASPYISITSREINKGNCAEDPCWEDPGGELDIFSAAVQESLTDLGYFSSLSMILMLDIEALLYLLNLTKEGLGFYLRNVNTSHLARYGSPLSHLQPSFQQLDGAVSGEMSLVAALKSISNQLQTQVARLSLEDPSGLKSAPKSAPPGGATAKKNLSIYNTTATPIPQEDQEEENQEEEEEDQESDNVSSITKKRKRGPASLPTSADSKSKRSKGKQRYDKRPTPFRPSENFFTPPSLDSGRSSLSTLTSSSTQAASSASSAASAASKESEISPYCDLIQPRRSSRGVSDNGPKRKLLFAEKKKT